MPQFIVGRDERNDDPYAETPLPPAVPTPATPPVGGDSVTPGSNVPVVPVGGTSRPKAGGGDQGYNPGSGPSYRLPGVPTFTPPTFARPTLNDAYNEPGYQFRSQAGTDALQRSAAARGVLRTGGTLKDIVEYGQNFAAQEYGQVFNRALSSYDRQYQGAHDAFAPKMADYQTRAQAEIARANALYQQQFQAYTYAHPQRGGGGGGGSPMEAPPKWEGSIPAAPPPADASGGGGAGGGGARQQMHGYEQYDPYQYY